MMVDVSDRALIQRAVDGDVDALGRLLREHDDRMRAVAYRMLGSRSAMDDALQAAYLNAFRGLSRFRAEADFGTWLHRIVVNACYDLLRRDGRRQEVSLQAIPDLESTESLDSVEEQLVLNRQLHEALASLPHDFRAAVVLVDGEGLSYAEAADVLGIERGTVASRLNRARSVLRERLTAIEEDER